MTSEEYKTIIQTIPHDPGIYKYFDKHNELLYVGKAKSLRKRVSSYFTKTFTGYKTHELVSRISRIEFTIVNSEQDAFLLENSLIKQYQPRFNINLKDDKSYPFIVIKNESFPRIFLTRRKVNDGSVYLGPYTSAGKVRELLSFIRQFIPLRTCKLNLTEQNIKKGKFKVCLEYHLGNCKGPCQNFQSAEEYADGLQQVRQLLKGNLSPVIQEYKKAMLDLASDLQFEKAALIKKKIEYLEHYQSKSVIVNKHLNNIDVFSVVKEGDSAFVNYLMIQSGTIVQTHNEEIQTSAQETLEDILGLIVMHFREIFNSTAKEIIVQCSIPIGTEKLLVTVPKGGDKKKLLDLSLKNAAYFLAESKRAKSLQLGVVKNENKMEVLEQMEEALQLPNTPVHIECFDNSNFQGSYPVSAMVCFKDGVPSKKDYRHFNVKSVEGINDFATMKEVVYRRYKRLTDEGQSLPQLIIIDGGKGQLSAAMESIQELKLHGKITLIGLAKREEEIFFPGDSEPLRLPMDGSVLKLIRYIRDEVHRFGITFHRQKRSKGTFKNDLESIPGIGPGTSSLLLNTFRSVKNIKNATTEDLSKLIGSAKAKLILDYFNEIKKGSG
ncbi:MAG TPA: excinuclease ABC subunit UvrC [Panacibacter sp.]|nr:excinuclease ABC subunit UvrC [Panacibacter sp.]HNP47135.1 excinuclease ABC subunit UvrC [Panacibacter sp.]